MTFLRPIILVEDNPDDEKMTIRALRRGNIAKSVFEKFLAIKKV